MKGWQFICGDDDMLANTVQVFEHKNHHIVLIGI